MFVITHRYIFLGLSLLFVLVSLGVIVFGGLRFGVDFTGGSILEVEYTNERPAVEALQTQMKETDFTGFLLQPTGEKGLIVRTETLSEEGHANLIKILAMDNQSPLTERRFSFVGGIVGKELQGKAWVAFVIISIAIILYVAFAFRRASEALSSWAYGVVAVLALFHNVVVPTGVFAILGQYFIEYQIDILFVTALLAIFGFSINDTIVIFDRVRENVQSDKEDKTKKSFAVIVGESISQTLARSINISLAMVLVLASLYFLGGESTREFSLVLGLGVVFGTYSSICFAAPLLVVIGERKGNRS